MLSEYLRISHSIDSIDCLEQLAPTYNWIKVFSEAFSHVMGVQEKKQLLLNQLSNIEL